jgi:hypothetical protein
MKKFVSVVVALVTSIVIVSAPSGMLWHFLSPVGFWERVLSLVLVGAVSLAMLVLAVLLSIFILLAFGWEL